MASESFKWKHYQADIILLCVRWYLKYPLSYRNLEEMMQERGLYITHTTIMRWVHQYGPEIEQRIRKYLKPTNDSWRVDETYVKVNGKWTYLYRAVDSNGDTIDFMLSAKRDTKAARRFFIKALRSPHNQNPRVITVDKNPAYPRALNQLKNKVDLHKNTKIRQIKYLNNIVEQDHRFIKKMIKPGLGFKSFKTARRTLKGIEAFHMIKKGQIENLSRDALSEVAFIDRLFDIVA